MTIKSIRLDSTGSSPVISSGISTFATSPITPIALDKIQSSIPRASTTRIIPQTSIILRGPTVTGAKLANIIQKNPGIVTLTLEECENLKNEDLQQLAKLTHLTHLFIECPDITDAGLQHLIRCASLEHLHLSSCSSLSEHGVETLKNLKSLKYLTLFGDNITDLTLRSVAEISSLKGLNVSNCENVTNEGLKFLTKDKLPFLEQLDLGYSNITDEGIIESIAKLSSLKELDLSLCNITDKSLERLFALSALKRLNLSEYPMTDKALEYVSKIESLAELVCDKCHEITIAGLEQLKPTLNLNLSQEFFRSAIETSEPKLLSLLLKKAVPIDIDSLLYQAVVRENKECIKLLLEYGGDPDKSITLENATTTTPCQQALKSDNLGLIALILSYRKDTNQPLPDLPVSSEPKKFLKNREFEKCIAKSFGPLVVSDKLRLYSSYCISELRKAMPSLLTDRLLKTPPPTIEHVINPLIHFIVNEILSDPKFAVYVLPVKKEEISEVTLGGYIPKSGDIFLYVPSDTIAVDEVSQKISISLKNFKLKTTLLHELAHKAIDKLGWHLKNRGSQIRDFAADVKRDIAALKRNKWIDSDPSVKDYLSSVTLYPENQQFEESLVRTVQILSDMAEQNPNLPFEDLEVLLENDIPNLYRIFKEHFLPELEDYNQRISASASS